MCGEDLTTLSKMCHFLDLHVYISTVLLFLFGSINQFLKQKFSPNQQSFVVTFVAAVSLFWSTCLYRAVQNLTSSNFEDLKIVGDF